MIDISKNYVHKSSFPVNISSANNTYGKIWNGVTQRNTDNGELGIKGDYVNYDQYEIDDLADNTISENNGFAGIIRGKSPDNLWEIEVTALPSDAIVVYLYNSPVSEYPEVELQDEKLFYTKSGVRIQAMELKVTDVFTMSDNGFSGKDPKAGAAVTYSGNKYVVA